MQNITDNSKRYYICFEVDKDLNNSSFRLDNCCITGFGNLDCMVHYWLPWVQNLTILLASADAGSQSPKSNI